MVTYRYENGSPVAYVNGWRFVSDGEGHYTLAIRNEAIARVDSYARGTCYDPSGAYLRYSVRYNYAWSSGGEDWHYLVTDRVKVSLRDAALNTVFERALSALISAVGSDRMDRV